MSAEYSDVKFCPYWRRYQQYGDYILALCARNSPKEPKLPEDELTPRLRRCPWFYARTAYTSPAIIECHINEVSGKGRPPTEVIVADYSGSKGAMSLEAIWDYEVEKLIERHS